MQDTIKEIIDRYGKTNVRYAVIVYGKTTTTVTHFREFIPTLGLLKERIETAPRSTGGSALDKGLDEAKMVFEKWSTRVNAKKILVVITDSESGVAKNDIRYAGKNEKKNKMIKTEEGKV